MSLTDAILALSLFANLWLSLALKEERNRDTAAWKRVLKNLEDSLYA